MRIIAVRFKNLNSLAGSWEIDLTSPEYTGSGIFAIVGATGSGKSTILDAVSLALYGRTPRLKQISKSANDIMTHQTGECSAELEFISAKGHFRCHWSQHRARRHAAGDLQQPRHEIADADSGKILEAKIKEVARKVVEVTGMDFDQFTRSMLLAQGEFNKFLQASSDERAPILEQITGTEIYSSISRQVHELTGNSKQQLEQLRRELSGFNLLTQEAEANVKEEMQNLAGSINQLQKDLELMRTQREWLNSLARLSSSCESLEKRLAALQEEHKTYAPEKTRLLRARAAAKIGYHYDRLEELKVQQEQDRLTLETTEQELKQVNVELAKLKENSQTLQQSRKKAGEQLKAVQPLLREVVQLDQLQSRLVHDIAGQNQALTTTLQTITAKDQECRQLQQQLQESGREAQRAQQYLTEHTQDRTLTEDLSGLRIIISSLVAAEQKTLKLKQQYSNTISSKSKLQEALPALDKSKAESARQLADQQKQVAAIQQQLDVTRSQNELFTVRQQLLEQLNEVQAMQQVDRELNAFHTRQKNIDTQLVARNKEQETLSQHLQQKSKELTNLRTLVEREEEIVLLSAKVKNFEQERLLLQHGTPCPLCGSPSHPFVDNEIPKHIDNPHERLRKARDAVECCSVELQKMQTSQARLEFQNGKDKELLDELDALIKQGEQRLAGFTDEIEKEEDIRRALNNRLQELQRLISGKDKEIQQRDELEKSLHLAKELYEKSEIAHRRQERAVETAHHDIGALEKEATSQKQELDNMLDDVARTQSELQQRFPEFAAKQEVPPLDLQIILKKIEDKARQYARAKEQFEKCWQQQQQLQASIQHVNENLAEQRKARSETEKKIQQLQGELETAIGKRKQLFGDKIVADEEQRLEELVAKTENALQQHNLHLSTLERNLVTLNERSNLTNKNLAARNNQIQAGQEQFRQLLTTSEFANEEIFLSSRLDNIEFTKLEQKDEQLTNRTVEATTLYNNTKAELAKEQERRLTDLQLPELERQIEEKNTHLANKQQQTGVLQRTLAEHREALVKYRDKQQQLFNFEEDYDYWCRLHDLIGSADGKKFRNFAQGITFELMIRHANQQLIKMSDRYILMRNTLSPLDLQVIDNYQGGELRTTANLSGGESFIVSLALALGLSAMAGKNIRVDTLFLDEGFGTLDEEALDVALDTLSSLHQDGKLIGIISHVHLLRDRIATQINLAAGSNGRSTISGPGVKRMR